MLEGYNGLGYASRGVPSPYLWAGTNQYKAGKYVRDGVYDPSHVDVQPGCAGMLLAMMKIDPSIKMTGAPISTVKKTTGAVVAGGAVVAAQQSGLGIGWIFGIAAAVALVAFLAWKFKK